jgi:tetratricopeptide (TPR) repeat protein
MGTNVTATTAERRLNSWKEIGAFFSRDERTVKRWEVDRGLPVHRIPGRGGTKVFGFVGELTDWLMSGSTARPTAPVSGPAVLPPHGGTVPVVRTRARELYLAGMYYCNLLTEEGLERARSLFAEAVAIDPDYAEGYVGLALCFTQLRRFALMPDGEAYARAGTEVERAVALDDSLPEAQSLLGVVSFYGSWDIPAALRAFSRALTLDPASSMAHHRYAMVLLHIGHFETALAEITTAQVLNPVYRAVLADKGRILFHAGRQDEAVTLLEQLVQADPDFMAPHAYLAICRLARGEHALYLDSLLRAAELRRDEGGRAVALAGRLGLEQDGPGEMARAMLAERQQRHARGLATSYDLAQAHALAGEDKVALECLHRSIEQRESPALNFVIDPAFARLHRAPSLQRLAADLGFTLP